MNHKFAHLLHAILCEQNAYVMKLLAINAWLLWCNTRPIHIVLTLPYHPARPPACVCVRLSVWSTVDHFHILLLLVCFSRRIPFLLVSFVFTTKWPTSSLKWSIKRILQPIRFATLEWENKHQDNNIRNGHTHESASSPMSFLGHLNSKVPWLNQTDFRASEKAKKEKK